MDNKIKDAIKLALAFAIAAACMYYDKEQKKQTKIADEISAHNAQCLQYWHNQDSVLKYQTENQR